MYAPDAQEHIAVRYQALGYSVLPLDPGQKRPNVTLLPGRAWGPYQASPAPRELVKAWAGMVPEPNWGLVCGQVSHGLYCGDCDDFYYAQWVLAHARDPIMRGACIVKSGSGKAHIWFLSPTRLESHVWKPRQGAKVGDVRGDGRPGALGSYMVVPPSIHPDTGQPYEVVAGGFDTLPVIDNGEAFLDAILAAYRQEVPEGEVPQQQAPTRRAALTLTAEERLRVQNHVRDLMLKRKIQDTLLVPGMRLPGSRHWQGLADDSRSAVDFAVVCELIRKDQTFDQIEQIFAGTEIGLNRYALKERGHSTGPDYLRRTYDNALKEIEQQRRNSRVAKGTNFEVLEVTRMRLSQTALVYHLTIQYIPTSGDPYVREVDVPAEVLIVEDRFTREVFQRAAIALKLSANHRGKHNYPDFAQAVVDMVSEDRKTPAAMTREGHLALELWTQIRSIRARDTDPATMGEVLGIGWRIGDTYYLKVREVYRKLQSIRGEFHYEDLGKVLLHIGTYTHYEHVWPDGAEHMYRIERQTKPRPELPALPAPS